MPFIAANCLNIEGINTVLILPHWCRWARM